MLSPIKYHVLNTSSKKFANDGQFFFNFSIKSLLVYRGGDCDATLTWLNAIRTAI